MQGRHLFEYAVIRVVPRVEREEFVNVGVILYCAEKKYLNSTFEINSGKLQSVFEEIDISEISANTKAIALICKGGKLSGPIGMLDVASRFRWLTATRSTVIQSSKVHPGFCSDPEEMLVKLFEELVR